MSIARPSARGLGGFPTLRSRTVQKLFYNIHRFFVPGRTMSEENVPEKRPRKKAMMLVVGAVAMSAALIAVAVLLPPSVDARVVTAPPGEAVLSEDDLGERWQLLSFAEQPGNASQNLVGTATIGIGNYTMPSMNVVLGLLVYESIEDAEIGFNRTIEDVAYQVSMGWLDYEPVEPSPSVGDEAARYEATLVLDKTYVQQYLVFRQQNVVCAMRVTLTEPLPSEDLMMTFAAAQDEKVLRLLE